MVLTSVVTGLPIESAGEPAEQERRSSPDAPATAGEAAPSRWPERAVRSEMQGSFRISFLELIQQRADVAQLLSGGAAAGERLQHELRGRAAERAIHEVAEQLPLGALLAQPRHVDVGALRLVAHDKALVRHDLQQLEHGSVAA